MNSCRWLLIGAACLGTAAQAYEIRVRKIFQLKHDVHESITAMAEECLGKVAPQRPTGCWSGKTQIADRARSRFNESYSDRQKASRWPDDPTRQDRRLSFLKIGYNVYRGCEKRIKNNRNIENAGLLCSSHYGKLQFFHAQRADEDPTHLATYTKIMQWARFAYRVAAFERLGSERDPLLENYCAAIAREPAELAAAMQLTDQTYCTDRDGYPAWTVRTFFTFTCSNPFHSGTCGEPLPGVEGDRKARIAATGALLHLVQDSFSQSHVSRSVGAPVSYTGGPDGFQSKVVCRFPTEYFNYRDQERDARGAHKKADRPPIVREGCADAAANGSSATVADDVVTASAMVLWHVDHGTEESFLDYLRDRVFGPPPAA